jgi:hypothetical protein
LVTNSCDVEDADVFGPFIQGLSVAEEATCRQLIRDAAPSLGVACP